jgi:hypothetical protein
LSTDYIFIAWESPHSVWLDLDSDSNRFDFLIVILTCYSWVSYHGVTIVGTLQTGYPHVHASGQDKRQGMRPHVATCHRGTGTHLPA